MNLNGSPSVEQLKDVLACCDDTLGHHILWVAKYGDVILSLLPDGLTPLGFEQILPQMQIRYETFEQHNGYVGSDAASSDVWVSKIFRSLLREWPSARDSEEVVYVDVF